MHNMARSANPHALVYTERQHNKLYMVHHTKRIMWLLSFVETKCSRSSLCSCGKEWSHVEVHYLSRVDSDSVTNS